MPEFASPRMSSDKVALYSSVGPVLTHYDVDVGGAALVKHGSVTLPANVQYAWPHASRQYLYVASSSSAPGAGPAGTEHHVSAFRIDPASGALAPHGNPVRLPTRPIHLCTDVPSEHLLVAFNNPSALRVYRINRADTTAEFEGRKVFAGGENTLAVYSINPSTGEPALIQHVDTRGIHCRTFHIDPSGRMLVAAHTMGLPVRDGGTVRDVPACMSVFRIGSDGRLDYVRKYDVDVGRNTMFWMGMVRL